MTTFADVLAMLPAPHTVTVEAFEGGGGYGDEYADPVEVTCVVDAKRRQVRAPDGSQVLSSATVYAPPGTVAPPRSLVTLPDGSATRVIEAIRRDGAGLPVPSHTEIVCE